MRSTATFLSTFTLAALAAVGCGNLTEYGPSNVAYTPDGRLVAFLPGETRIYDSEGQRTLRNVATRSGDGGGWVPFAARLVLSKDGSRFAVGVDESVDVYSVQTGSRLASIKVTPNIPNQYNPIAGVALSPVGDLVAVAVHPIGEGPARLAIWKVDNQALVTEIVAAPEHDVDPLWMAGLAFSPDGKTLYGVENGRLPVYPYVDSRVTAWTVSDGSRLWTSPSPLVLPPDYPAEKPFVSSPRALAVSPDGNWVATASFDTLLRRATDGAIDEQFQAPVQETPADTIAFSPDGQKVVTTYGTNQVPSDAIVFGRNGQIARAFPVEGGGCEGAVFSPDGARVAAACTKWIKIWSFDTGELVRRVKVTGELY